VINVHAVALRYEPACNEEHKQRVSSLSQHKLWISDPNKFNDPLDLKPMLSLGEDWKSNSPHYLKFLRSMLEYQCDNLDNPIFPSKEEIINVMNGFELNGESDFIRCIETKIAQFGVQCFSRRWDLPLSWAHYSSGHKGYVIEYEAKEMTIASNNSGVCHFDDVTYVNKLPEINLAECIFAPHASLQRVLATKASLWAYENEVRLIHYQNKAELADMPKGLTVACIIAGASIEESSLEVLKKKANELDIPIEFATLLPDGKMKRYRK
jgi:hypothetical protein